MRTPFHANRLPALDSLRGVLALLVVAFHLTVPFGLTVLVLPSFLSVLAFFAMSGFVLARAYDGRYGAFVARRLVRLWPLYAACIVVGYALIWRRPPAAELAWWPIPPFGTTPEVDSPAWSLYYEAWATPLFPALFWVAAKSRIASVALALCVAGLGLIDFRWFLAAWFVVGVTASRFRIRLPERLPGVTLWLGKISYSLYISHQIVLSAGERAFGPWGGAAMLPAVFVVAWACWRWVEVPSIALSRRVGQGARAGFALKEPGVAGRA